MKRARLCNWSFVWYILKIRLNMLLVLRTIWPLKESSWAFCISTACQENICSSCCWIISVSLSVWTVTLMCSDSGVCWGKTKWSLFPDRSLECWSRTVRGLPVTFSFTQLKTVPSEDHRSSTWSTQWDEDFSHPHWLYICSQTWIF